MWSTVLILALAAPQNVLAGEHPIAGVISLLQKLEVQSKEEGAAEQASFQKFTYWCKTSEKTLTKAIKTSKKDIASLTDKIDGLTADIASLGEDIKALDADIKEMETASDKAKGVRDDEKTLYDGEQDNFKATIKAVGEAIDILKDSKSASLLQTDADTVQKHKVQKALILAEAMGKPAAKTYTFKSGAIIETFKSMKAQFEADKLDSTSAETNKLNAYNLAKQARDTALSTAKDSKKEKEGIKGDKESDKANSESSLSETEKALSGDTATLEQTDKECKTVTGEWEQRSAIREGEIKAMGMAIKILAKVGGVRNPDEHEIPAKGALLTVISQVQQDSSDYNAEMKPLINGSGAKTAICSISYFGTIMLPPCTLTFCPCLKLHQTSGSGRGASSSSAGGSSSVAFSFCTYSPVSWLPFLKIQTPLPWGLLYLNFPE